MSLPGAQDPASGGLQGTQPLDAEAVPRCPQTHECTQPGGQGQLPLGGTRPFPAAQGSPVSMISLGLLPPE